MKFFVLTAALVACSLVSSDAQAFHGRRGAVVVRAPGANVVVRGGGVFRQPVVAVNAGFAAPVVVRQRAIVSPVVVQPFGVHHYGVQPFVVPSYGVQSFNGGCAGFFGY